MIDIEIFKSNIIDVVKKGFEVKELEVNSFNEFYYPKIVHILKFNVEQYEVKGLGNMAILQGNGLGIIKMLTVIFTPSITIDIPFIIVDFIKMANKRTVLIEIYSNHIREQDKIKVFESRLNKLNSKYSNIPNYIEKPEWYTSLRNKHSPLKKGTKKNDEMLCKMVLEFIEEYSNYINTIKLNNNEKNKQLEEFITDLIYKGNPSKSMLEKSIGKDETIRLFKEIVFYYDGR